MTDKLKQIADAFWNPVPDEARSNRKIAWERLAPEMRVSRQMHGSHAHNCGATVGAMPRCDFACQGCYLGEEANQIPALPLDEVKKQIRLMRPFLGPSGNLQLTDGEITLRPEHELVELIQYARETGLLPMLMTHGDTFRRKPGLLERLMEAGLTEVSIHIDTDMRGRKGEAYKRAKQEEELNPLRDEFAQMLREAKKKTGRKIASATTMTITAENLPGVPSVMRWLVRNADVFKMISFQPMAQVGRTEEGLGGKTSVEALWAKISEGLYGDARPHDYLINSTYWMGHEDCNRYTLGSVLTRPNQDPHFEPFFRFDVPEDVTFVDNLRAHFGSINFRADDAVTAIARFIGAIREHAPTVGSVVPFAIEHIRRHDPENRWAVLRELVTGKSKIEGLNVVSHHFMSRQELESPRGQARLSMCVFKAAVGDKIVSMCETNATEVRENFYKDILVKFPKKKSAETNGTAEKAPEPPAE